MQCVQLREELSSLVDGELSPARAADLQRHVAECSACHCELGQLKQTASLMGSLVPVAPPPDLLACVQRKAAQAPPTPTLVCSKTREMLDEYAHGELEGDVAAALESHLIRCQACGRELERLEQSAGLLRELGEVSPPPRVRQRVQGELVRRSRPRFARPTFRGLLTTAAVAAAAAALMLLTRIPTATQHPMVGTGKTAPAPNPIAGAPAATPSLPATEGGVTVASPPASGTRARPTFATAPTAVGTATRTLARVMTAPSAILSAKAIGGAVATSEPPSTGIAGGRPETTNGLAAARPAETPALQTTVAYVSPAVEPEPAVASEGLPRPHPAREAVRASAMPVVESPLSEVRRLLMSEQRSEAPTFKAKKREPDRFTSGPIAAWGF